MKIPVFLYVDDLDDYVADRGKLTWNMDEIPFLMSKNNDELENNIKIFNQERYLDKLEKIFNKMKLLEDGKAAQRVADIVDNWI